MIIEQLNLICARTPRQEERKTSTPSGAMSSKAERTSGSSGSSAPGFELALALAPFSDLPSDFAPASEGASDGVGRAPSEGGTGEAAPAVLSAGGASPGAGWVPGGSEIKR